MFALCLMLCGCSDRAVADGARGDTAAEPLGVVAEESVIVKAVPAVVTSEAAPATENLPASTSPPGDLLEEKEGEVQESPAIESVEKARLDEVAAHSAEGVVIDPLLLPGTVVYHLPPNGGPTFAEKWSAEIMCFLGLLWAFLQRRTDVPKILDGLADGQRLQARNEEMVKDMAALRVRAEQADAELARFRRETARLTAQLAEATAPPPPEPIQHHTQGLTDFTAIGLAKRTGRV